MRCSTATLYALAFASDRWHAGQWSRGYRLGCRAREALLRLGISDPYRVYERGIVRESFAREVRSKYRRIVRTLKSRPQ